MDFDSYFDEAFICFIKEQKSKEEALEVMFNNLYEKGVVKESYFKALLDREVQYATGLQTSSRGVAIPHTDYEHVNEEKISIGVLEKSVVFEHMGMPEVSVDVEVIFMLAIKKPENQIGVLQIIMDLIQKEELLDSIKGAGSKEAVIDIIREYSTQKMTNGE
ncbi:PTS sugar transporter subunit IIA [Salinicoccus hispanicus]|uniref:PTS transporter subunit EIIA n=1 Tax=Salinicoccus hispanicus TaxID=157225 RepID=A0A6N8U2C1_9STAP|nr:PTS sugar transporter subunit IIA [Salinicoccus hispanicus]MXQ51487.1 PTS transporter subunit EIIA [Salinicoccus hispanicus]